MRRGPVRAALARREFRLIWLGSLGSNIGNWMQTFVLAKYVDDATHSGSWVGLVTFAQLFPILGLSLVGGVVADRFDRRRLLIALQAVQMVLSFGLAALLATDRHPAVIAIVAFVGAAGIANAINLPTYGALLPALVSRDELPGAISLNSAVVNGSRVAGPAIAGLLYSPLGAAWLLVINAVTFLFIIAALLTIRLPQLPVSRDQGWQALLGGLAFARRTPVVRHILVGMTVFSLLSLPFIGLFASLARVHLGLSASSVVFGIHGGATIYGLLYASFGLGALVGGLATGTFLNHLDRRRNARIGFAGFGVAMAAFAFLPRPAPAFVIVFVIGVCYFATTTSLLTILQQSSPEEVRGRVIALWFMSFGGMVSVAGLAFGPILDATSGRFILSIGAVAALALAWRLDLRRPVPAPKAG